MIRAEFYERTVIDPGAEKPYRYRSRWETKTYDGSALRLDQPPAVGDAVILSDGEAYRVLAREWLYASYGSVVWPYGKPEPEYHSCLIIVEKAEGVFADEAELTDEEREEE